MNVPTTEQIEEIKESEKLVAEFLKNGGTITKCPTRLAKGIKFLSRHILYDEKNKELTKQEEED